MKLIQNLLSYYELIFILGIFLIFSTMYLVPLAFATSDEYGSQINNVNIYQKSVGSWVLRDSINSTEYVEDMNVTIYENQNFLFNARGLLNASEFTYADVLASKYALGIQIYDDSSYASPFVIELPAELTDGFWLIDFVLSVDYDISSELTVCNVTEWIDYNNGTGYLLVEEWVFNLVYEAQEETPVSDELNLNFVYWWLFVICLFSTSINAVLVFRIGETKYVEFCLISLAFTIAFLVTLMN